MLGPLGGQSDPELEPFNGLYTTLAKVTHCYET